jgi:hypothetical protein
MITSRGVPALLPAPHRRVADPPISTGNGLLAPRYLRGMDGHALEPAARRALGLVE